MNNHQVNKIRMLLNTLCILKENVFIQIDYQADNITDEESHLTSVNLDTSIYDTTRINF